MRYERKFNVTELTVYEILQLIRIHPASIRRLYPSRIINNIYFDTVSMDTFHQNVEGLERRNKYRVRWYGEPTQKRIEKANLEIKMKYGELGDKKTMPVSPFDMSDLKGCIREVNQLVQYHQRLMPVLFNTYNRSYWTSANKLFRITVDTALSYRPVLHHSVSQITMTEPAIIIEVKYDEKNDSRFREIIDYLPFPLTKNSKYVNGVFLTSMR